LLSGVQRSSVQIARRRKKENVGREKGAIQGEIGRQTEEGIEKEATFFGPSPA